MVAIKGRRFLEEEINLDTIVDDTSLEDDDSTIGMSDVPQSSEDKDLVRHKNSLGDRFSLTVFLNIIFYFGY